MESKENADTLSFLTDEEKAKLTEKDLQAFRSKYAKIYVQTVETISKSPQYQALGDDIKQKVLTQAARRSSLAARGQTVQEMKATP